MTTFNGIKNVKAELHVLNLHQELNHLASENTASMGKQIINQINMIG